MLSRLHSFVMKVFKAAITGGRVKKNVFTQRRKGSAKTQRNPLKRGSALHLSAFFAPLRENSSLVRRNKKQHSTKSRKNIFAAFRKVVIDEAPKCGPQDFQSAISFQTIRRNCGGIIFLPASGPIHQTFIKQFSHHHRLGYATGGKTNLYHRMLQLPLEPDTSFLVRSDCSGLLDRSARRQTSPRSSELFRHQRHAEDATKGSTLRIGESDSVG